jgi:pyruvate formate lyase activating enzyme
MILTTYGRSSGFCVDPIEKKPLNHFYPGTSVLSFGTAGCNLGCKFCQNWDISKSREMDTLVGEATPNRIAEVALEQGCQSVAFTYNDPVIFAEYAIDTALACREADVKTVAVTAGYIDGSARADFFRYIDAANVDLKAFDDSFYKKICFGKLDPVLETLVYLVRETEVWVELTTLLIPGENDSAEALKRQCHWIASELGEHVPIHFTAFHPDWKMQNKRRTPASTLLLAREIAKAEGLLHVYVGNVHHREASSTYCSNCQALLIERDWYQMGEYNLDEKGACLACGAALAGRFNAQLGSWHGGRKPVWV